MAASSNMGTLWRRRIRVGTLALTITLALFSGQLQDVIRFFAAVVGLVIGQWIVGRSARGERIAGTQREGRVLVAIVVAASAIGPMIAALSPQAVGPLAVLRDLFRGVPWTVAEVRELCEESSSDPDCRRGLLELRLSGIGPTLLSLMPSIFVLVLSDGLRRGRRFAWIATVCAQVVLLVLSIGNFVIRFVDAVDSDSLFYGISDPNVYRTLVPFLTPLFVLILLNRDTSILRRRGPGQDIPTSRCCDRDLARGPRRDLRRRRNARQARVRSRAHCNDVARGLPSAPCTARVPAVDRSASASRGHRVDVALRVDRRRVLGRRRRVGVREFPQAGQDCRSQSRRNERDPC